MLFIGFKMKTDMSNNTVNFEVIKAAVEQHLKKITLLQKELSEEEEKLAELLKVYGTDILEMR